jgi:hypothetical protein
MDYAHSQAESVLGNPRAVRRERYVEEWQAAGHERWWATEHWGVQDPQHWLNFVSWLKTAP